MDLSKELETAKELSIKAGEKILEIYNSDDFEITEKKDESDNTSPLTKADLASNDLIVKGIRKKFPKIPILSEEEKDNKERLKNEFVWIIDPLDGTKEFIKRNGEFTVNIALVQDEEPVLGVIYVPVTDELYYASKGNGAFYQNQMIKVSNTKDPKDMIMAISRSHPSEKLKVIIKNFKETITSGSSIKGCIVARGEGDMYPRLGPINEWDICAMDIIVKEAGGVLTDLEGKPLKYNKKNSLIKGGFLASNNKIHDKLLEMMKND